jgi:hypothetical protein
MSSWSASITGSARSATCRVPGSPTPTPTATATTPAGTGWPARTCPVGHRRTWPRSRHAGLARSVSIRRGCHIHAGRGAWLGHPRRIHAVSAPYPRRAGGHHRSHTAGWCAGVSPRPPRGAGRAGRRGGRTTRTRHPRAADRANPWPRSTGQALDAPPGCPSRHGHPGPGLRWPAYDRKQRQTMVFGESSGAACDPAGRRQPEITSPARTAPRRPFRQAKRADRPSAVPAFPRSPLRIS